MRHFTINDLKTQYLYNSHPNKPMDLMCNHEPCSRDNGDSSECMISHKYCKHEYHPDRMYEAIAGLDLHIEAVDGLPISLFERDTTHSFDKVQAPIVYPLLEVMKGVVLNRLQEQNFNTKRYFSAIGFKRPVFWHTAFFSNCHHTSLYDVFDKVCEFIEDKTNVKLLWELGDSAVFENTLEGFEVTPFEHMSTDEPFIEYFPEVYGKQEMDDPNFKILYEGLTAFIDTPINEIDLRKIPIRIDGIRYSLLGDHSIKAMFDVPIMLGDDFDDALATLSEYEGIIRSTLESTFGLTLVKIAATPSLKYVRVHNPATSTILH